MERVLDRANRHTHFIWLPEAGIVTQIEFTGGINGNPVNQVIGRDELRSLQLISPQNLSSLDEGAASEPVIFDNKVELL